MKRVLIFLFIAVILARAYDLHSQVPNASLSQIVTMLAPMEIWLGGIVLLTAFVFIRRHI